MKKLFAAAVVLVALSGCNFTPENALSFLNDKTLENKVLNDVKGGTAAISQSIVPPTAASQAQAIKDAQPAVNGP